MMRQILRVLGSSLLLAALSFVLFSSNPIEAGPDMINSLQVGPLTIDSFETSQPTIFRTVPGDIGTSTSSTASGAGILGTERDIQITLTGGVTAGNRVDAGVGTGALSIGYDPTTVGTVQVVWDGADGDATTLDPTGLGNVDLTVGAAQDAFILGVTFDDNTVDLVIQVYTDGSNFSTLTLSLPGGIFTPTTNFVIPFSDFTPSAGAGADFTNVGAITWSVTASNAPDLVIDSFSTTALVTSNKADILLIDNDGDGLADPGDVLRYTVTITNPDDAFDAPATGVVFTDTPDPNTTLVVGSVTSTQGTITSGNSAGDTSVAVDIGTIVDGASVTITFEVTINDPLPDGVTQVANQGVVSSDTLTNTRTDDSDTGTPDDTTITPVDNPAPDDDDDDDDDVPPPAPAPSGGGGPAPTATPEFPTMLPETGEFPPLNNRVLDSWLGVIAGLVLIAGAGVWFRLRSKDV